MLKTTIACALVALSAGPALAGGQADSLGVGAEFQMNGLTGGASVNYDLGKMHFGGFVGFFDDGNDTDYTIGGRFYYHVHSTGNADFGIGGSLGWYSDEEMDNRATLLFVEPGIQIRAFIVPNVALSVSAGIILGLSDADGTAITGGQVGNGVTGGAGIHYYFF
jgi:hypothetical protein